MRLFKTQYVISYIINTHAHVEVLYPISFQMSPTFFFPEELPKGGGASPTSPRFCGESLVSTLSPQAADGRSRKMDGGKPWSIQTVERLCFKWGSPAQQVIGVIFVGKSSNKKLMNPETPQDAMFEV